MPETPDATPKPDATPPDGTPPAAPPPAADGQPPADGGKPVPSDAGGDVLDTPDADGAKPDAAGDVLSVDDGPKPEGVPDSYTFEPPEGLNPEAIDEAKLEAFKEKARDFGLSQDQFQQLLEYDFERTQAAADEAVSAWNERVNGWRDAARKDTEFGGENYDANVAVALKAVEAFGDKEFKALLKSPSEDNPEGLAIGNHPAVLRFLNRIGKKLGDPNLVQGDGVKEADGNEARLKRLYPSMFKESA